MRFITCFVVLVLNQYYLRFFVVYFMILSAPRLNRNKLYSERIIGEDCEASDVA